MILTLPSEISFSKKQFKVMQQIINRCTEVANTLNSETVCFYFPVIQNLSSKSAVTLQRMTSTQVSVCSYADIRQDTFVIRRVRFNYADICLYTSYYTQMPNYFLDMFEIVQRIAYYISIRLPYAGYVRNPLNTLE